MIAIGMDSGTQSTKAIALDLESSHVLASEQKSYGLAEGLPDGHLEQEPGWWTQAAEESVASCIAQLGDRRSEVCAMGVSGQQHGLVPLDADGNPVRAAKLWCDTSTASQCQEFEDAFGGKPGLIELAGNAVLPGYTAPKILWLKQNEPDHFAKTRSILLPHDYLNFWLTGKMTMEYGDASGTALMDIRKREWRRELTDFIDERVIEMLPDLTSSAASAGNLRPELAKAWGLKGDVVVSAGGGDNMMGAIGTGNVRAGVVTASFGTSGTLYACAGSPMIDGAGEVAAFCDSTDQWLPLVCTMNVTVATGQVRALFGMGFDELESAVASSAPGAGGVVFLPYLNGERTPNLPNGKGVFYGLTAKNMTGANMVRAAMEGATLGLAYGLQRFRELGVEPDEIRLTGGGSKSAAWRQMAADIFNADTVCLGTGEGAALGAAIQAGWCAANTDGKSAGIDAHCDRLVALDESTRCKPNPANAEIYHSLLSKFTGLTGHLASGGYL